ncbi:kinase-like domain-containing protein [Rhizophagus diaphanus]|nr:kinase-like domain-containing protein [Rhizophagus diaphanus] [Rhizophagus sp. MUCL 43196]
MAGVPNRKNANLDEWTQWSEDGIAKGYINYHGYNEFQNINCIGTGGFGKVYQATWESSDTVVALKSLQNNGKDNVKLNYLFILEYADNVSCLHRKDIIHHDLHSDNILVIKLADFGLSRRIAEVSSTPGNIFGMLIHSISKSKQIIRIKNYHYKANKKSCWCTPTRYTTSSLTEDYIVINNDNNSVKDNPDNSLNTRTEKDESKTFELYETANRKNGVKAFELYKKAAERGHIDAICNLREFYIHGSTRLCLDVTCGSKLTIEDNGKLWVLGSGDYCCNSSDVSIKDYCPSFGDCTIVTVHLDMNKRTCVFTVNGTKYPEVSAWNNLPSKLYPVVYVL